MRLATAVTGDAEGLRHVGVLLIVRAHRGLFFWPSSIHFLTQLLW